MVHTVFFFYGYGDHRDLHVLTHSFPTRRSSDLRHASNLSSTRPFNSAAWPLTSWPMAMPASARSEEHTSELQSLMRTSYAVFCLKQTNPTLAHRTHTLHPIQAPPTPPTSLLPHCGPRQLANDTPP